MRLKNMKRLQYISNQIIVLFLFISGAIGSQFIVYNMKKDKRVIQAEEILDVLEENPKHSSNLIGGFITILVGVTVLNEIKKQLN